MALIKPRTRGKQLVRHRTRLDRETNETLYAYAHFLGEPTEYVLNQVIDTVLGKDKDFLQWRADASGVVRAARRAAQRPTPARDAAAGRAAPCRQPRLTASVAPRMTRSDADAPHASLDARVLLAMAVAAAVGRVGPAHVSRSTQDDVFLALIEARRPDVFSALVYGYATLWFTTPFFVASLLDVAGRHRRLPARAARCASARCRRIPSPRRGRRRSLVLGEAHHRDTPGRAPRPDVADDPAARALHRRHDPRRGRHRQDVRLHVSVRGPAPALAQPTMPTARSAAW